MAEYYTDFEGYSESLRGMTLDPRRTVCFSGHRPEKLPPVFSGEAYLKKLKSELRGEIMTAVSRGYDTFFCGMQRGVDLWAADEVLFLREICPKLRLIGVSPYSSEINSRRGRDRLEYERVRDSADGFITLSRSYFPNCFIERNRFMVDRSSLLIAAVCDYSSGTGSTVSYAKSKRLNISVIDINGIAAAPL